MANHRKVRFRRIRGRIVPIRQKKGGREKRAARELFGAIRGRDVATLGAAGVGSLGGLFAAGRLQKESNKLLAIKKIRASTVLNKLAKITKFTSKFAPALIAGAVFTGLDRRTKLDEESKFFNLGSKTGAFNIAAAGVGALALARFGKRFEKFGLRGGKFPFKLRDI